MTSHHMNDFFEKNGELSTAKIRGNGLFSVSYPEFLSGDELAALMALAGQDQIDIRTFEFGQTPERHDILDIEKAKEIVFAHGHKNILIKFPAIVLFIWVPEGAHHFVIFGDERIVAEIHASRISDDDFRGYMAEESFSGKMQAFLPGIDDRFNISDCPS